MDGDRKVGAVAGGVKLPASMAPPAQKSRMKLSVKRLMPKLFDDVDIQVLADRNEFPETLTTKFLNIALVRKFHHFL